MDNQLLLNIIRSTKILADQVLQNNVNDTTKKFAAEFTELYNRVSQANYTFTQEDYGKALIGAFVIADTLETRISHEREVLDDYRNNIIPELEKLMSIE